MKLIRGFLIVVIFGVVNLLSVEVLAVDIGACGVLSTVGGTYTLTSNVVAPGGAGTTCFHVTAPAVTIDLNNFTVTGHISGNASSTLGFTNAKNFTVKNGRVEGDVTAEGITGANGGNGGDAGNGGNSVNTGGSGLGGLGGASGSNGGACAAIGGNSDDGLFGFDDDTGGNGGVGGMGQDGCNGGNGASVTLQTVYVTGNVSTKGGNGGNGGNGGRGGNGGSPNGAGGQGGTAGNGGNGSSGGQINIATSTIVGTINASTGHVGNGGIGGNGGNGANPLGDLGPSGGGGTAPANGAFNSGSIFIQNTKILSGIVNGYRSPCGLNGSNGQPGTGQGVGPEVTLPNFCNSNGTSLQPTITIIDTAPVMQFSGPTSLTISAGSQYFDPVVNATDDKDGVLVPTVSGVFTPLVPGTYTRAYIVVDAGTSLTVNGVLVTYQPPQEVRTTQTVIVTPSAYSTIGGSSGGDAGSNPAYIQEQNTSNIFTDLGIKNRTAGTSYCSDNKKHIQHNLYVGNANNKNEVKLVQRLLNKVNNSDLKIDGVFGRGTRAQVVMFQKKYIPKIAATGMVLKSTRNTMNIALCELGW